MTLMQCLCVHLHVRVITIRVCCCTVHKLRVGRAILVHDAKEITGWVQTKVVVLTHLATMNKHGHHLCCMAGLCRGKSSS